MYTKSFLILVGAFFLSAMTHAKGISTHVLDLASGLGGSGVPVVLEVKSEDGQWKKLSESITDENGRVKKFDDATVSPGLYKLVFDMTKYSGSKDPAFFPEISVVFQIENSSLHYHVPVVVSPFGYSTYRGN